MLPHRHRARLLGRLSTFVAAGCATTLLLTGLAACGQTFTLTVIPPKIESCPTVHPTQGLYVTRPAFADGVVYAAVTGHEVAALRAGDGTLLWQQPDPIGTLALSVNQGVVVLADNSKLAGLRASDGMLLWQLPRGAVSPEMVDQGVLAAQDSAGLYAVRLSDGQLLWRLPGGQPFYAVRLVADGVLYAEATDQSVEAVRLSDGAILWLHSGATQGGLPLAVVAGRLYVLGAGVLIVRASDGYPEGVLPFSVSGSGTPPVTGTFYGGIVSDDVLYTTFSGSPPGTTYAVRLEDGALLWHAVLDTVTNYAAVVDNGLLFTVGSELTAARSTDGALLWRYPTDPQTPHYGLLLFPVVGAGAVYLSQAGSVSFCTPSQNQPAKFIALSERDESVLWERPLSALS